MNAPGRFRWASVAAWLAGLVLSLPVLLLPVRAAADVWRAPALLPQRWGTRALEVVLAPGNRAIAATANSLAVAVVTTLIAFVLGWSAARWLSTASTRGRIVVLGVLGMPLLVPPLAVGVGLTEWLLRLGLTDSYGGLVLAHLVAVLPYVVMVLAPAFSQRLRQAEEAAGVLGASPRDMLWKVTIPMLAPNIAVAALVGFLVSWGQYGTSLAVGGGIPMLPLLLQPFVGRDPQVAALLAIIFLLPALALLAVTVRRTTARR